MRISFSLESLYIRVWRRHNFWLLVLLCPVRVTSPPAIQALPLTCSTGPSTSLPRDKPISSQPHSHEINHDLFSHSFQALCQGQHQSPPATPTIHYLGDWSVDFWPGLSAQWLLSELSSKASLQRDLHWPPCKQSIPPPLSLSICVLTILPIFKVWSMD